MSTQPDLALLSRGAAQQALKVPLPRTQWQTRVLLPLTILISFGGLLGYTARDALFPPREVNVVPVVVKRGGEVAASVSFQAAGWVEPDPFPEYITALTDGVVEEVLVLEGQPVKRGQVVVRMVKVDARLSLESASATLARKIAEIKLAEAELKAAEDSFKPANRVDRNLAVQTAQTKLAEHQAELLQLKDDEAAAKAQLGLLEEQLDREKKTRAKNPNAVSEFTIVKTKLRLQVQQATLASVKAKRPILLARIEEQKARIAAAKLHLSLAIAETRAVAVAKAQLERAKAERVKARTIRDEAQLRYDRMDVVSPVDGVVMRRMVSRGSKLMLGMDGQHSAHAVHVYDPEKLQVRVDVKLADAARVSVGQSCKIVVDVLPDREFQGKVTRIVNQADVQKNTLQVKVAIEKPDRVLKPDMLARVQFVAIKRATKGEEDALRVFVPESMLTKGDKDAATTWIVDKGRGVAARRSVTVGAAKYDSWVEVVGLQPGDQLIAGDPAQLKDGLKVKVVGEARVR